MSRSKNGVRISLVYVRSTMRRPARFYKCFGCGKSGHAVGFVMEIEQCGFADAVKQIAKKYHIEVEEREMTTEERQRQDDRESMFVVNDFANKWFQDQLWNTQEGQAIGLSYFRERGLREDTIKKFQLGYSPEKGNPLAKALKTKGFKEKYIINDVDTHIGTGVCGKSEDGRIYDRFRDRVIFPIHSVSGKTVGFAGRILKKELYGLFLAKQAIAREDLCYLVEGQMDVISMHQAGIENVVASGGTALTKPQIRLIRRFTPNITVLYDGDAAGIHAALRGIDMFLEEGFNVKVLLLPNGEDPDSFANSHNASEFIEYIRQNQTDFIRFKGKLLSESAGRDPQKRAELIKDVVESIAQIPDAITRQVYIKDSAEQLHIQEQLLIREVARLRREKAVENDKRRQQKEQQLELAKEAQSTAIMSDPSVSDNKQPSKDRPQNSKQAALLNENIRNLLQIIVRYGERPLYQEQDGTSINAGTYIIEQMKGDDIEISNPTYQTIIDEFSAHHNDPGFVAENFFKFHPNTQVSNLAVDLIADKYQLSRIFSRQNISENVVQEIEVQSDADRLTDIVPQLLLELKYTIINIRIDKMTELMKQAQENDDWDLLRELMGSQPALLEVKNQISKQLGNRVITA